MPSPKESLDSPIKLFSTQVCHLLILAAANEPDLGLLVVNTLTKVNYSCRRDKCWKKNIPNQKAFNFKSTRPNCFLPGYSRPQPSREEYSSHSNLQVF